MMVVNAAQIGDAGGKLVFSDSSRISSWALNAVAFRPEKSATRAEAAAVVMNLCN
ncbi:MAG: hypothetical protein ACOY46_00650 [Bacillota bacterium]